MNRCPISLTAHERSLVRRLYTEIEDAVNTSTLFHGWRADDAIPLTGILRRLFLSTMQAEAGDTVGPVYLAGPITPKGTRTVEKNVQQACTTLEYLTRRRVSAICPQLTALMPGAFDVPYEDWMAVDFVLLETCAAVLVLPGWETSDGTKREIEHATARGIPVFWKVDRLLEALGVGARAARPFGAPPRS